MVRENQLKWNKLIKTINSNLERFPSSTFQKHLPTLKTMHSLAQSYGYNNNNYWATFKAIEMICYDVIKKIERGDKRTYEVTKLLEKLQEIKKEDLNYMYLEELPDYLKDLLTLYAYELKTQNALYVDESFYDNRPVEKEMEKILNKITPRSNAWRGYIFPENSVKKLQTILNETIEKSNQDKKDFLSKFQGKRTTPHHKKCGIRCLENSVRRMF